MAQTKTAIANKPVWVDLGTDDPAAARTFYSKLFGWKIEVNPDPQYGGYAMGEIDGKQAAGIGGKMSPQHQPHGRSTSAPSRRTTRRRKSSKRAARSWHRRLISARRDGWRPSPIPSAP